jgi:hypothetical protein
VSDAISPVLNLVSPSAINDTSEVVIEGSLFGTVATNVIVKIGEESCAVTKVIDTQIKCTVEGIQTGEQIVSVNIEGVGNAKNPSLLSITGILSVKGIEPNSGSIYGGQLIEIQGNGFDMNTRVAIGDFPCFVESASASSLFCRTSDSTTIPMSTQAPPTSTKMTTLTARPTTTTPENKCLDNFLTGMLS